MPMIDVTATRGRFSDKDALTKALSRAMMRWEGVPEIPLFLDNTAAFIHELDPDALGTAGGTHDVVRVQVLTPTGILDREKKIGVVRELTDLVADAANDPTLKDRTWVLIVESPDGGWGMGGHAYTNDEIVERARKELAGGTADA